MRLIIDEEDFQRLSRPTRNELVELFAGGSRGLTSRGGTTWQAPMDLSAELSARLVHGLADNHRRRLELFARSADGRVSMTDLLAATGDRDVRALSYFQGAITRKLRRLLDDPDRRIHLIGWDYGTTRWDAAHQHIVEGICYVTAASRRALRAALGIA